MSSSKSQSVRLPFASDVAERLLKPFAIALRGRVMLLAAVGVFLVWAGDAMLGASLAQPETSGERTWSDVLWAGPVALQAVYIAFVEPFVLFAQGEAMMANLLRCVLRLVVWGFVGGAIARVAALALTRDDSPSLAQSLEFAWQNKAGFIGGPLLMLAGLLAVAMPLLLVRLVMQVSWLASVAAVLWPLVIVAAAVLVLFGIGVVVGWPLVGSAVATDGGDAFDAVSRMFAYVFQKPLKLIGYLAVVTVLGSAAAIAGHAFATDVTRVSLFAAGESTNEWATTTATWWTTAASSLVWVYLSAFIWTAAAGIYLLRRQDVDGVPTDEVFIAPDVISDRPERSTDITTDAEPPCEAA